MDDRKVISWVSRGAGLVGVVTVVAGVATTNAITRAPSTTERCPEKAQSVVRSPAPGAQQQLVPPGALSVTVCRYRGLNDPNPRYANQLVGSARVADAKQVQSLGDQFNSLPPPSGAPAACPADDGSSMLAIFEYSGSPADPVLVHPTGCSYATNGYTKGNVALKGGQTLRTELQHLTGCASSLENWWCNSDPLPSTNTSHPRRRDATVTGYIRLCGGPAPGRCYIETFTSCQPQQGCITTDRIAVIDNTGQRVATRKLHHARFHLRLLPGQYTIELLGDGKHAHGRVMQSKKITARAHRTAKVVFFYAIP